MSNPFSKSKKAKTGEERDVSVYDFDTELEEEQVPSNTYLSGSTNYFFSSSYHRKSRLPVVTSAPSFKRQVQLSTRGKSGDENQVSTSGYSSKQGMSRSKDMLSYPNQVVVTASRARLGQHYGRFLTVIFSSKHIEVKQSKEILSRKWQREDLCVFKSFYKFYPKSADEKALVILQVHKRRVHGRCSNCECSNPSDLTETLVMEIGNDLWKEQQRKIFEVSQAYRHVWKRIEEGEELLEFKERLLKSRYPLEDLPINGNPTRNAEPEIIPEMLSPPARLSQEVCTFETLVYPLGDPDAVTITTKDLEILRPMGFLNDTIIDFYIKYLQTKLSDEDKGRFYFFNSFFFRKLVNASNNCTGPDQGKVFYEQLRKWTRKVSLFEKDYIFIPVNQSLHWSLIIVCHLGSLGRSPDECRGTPCILHLDSMEGSHLGIEDHVRNYLLQVWIEEQKTSANCCSEVTLFEMKYVEAMVPQQINHCDCGTYLLHFVELFLKKAPQQFSLDSSDGFPYFLTRDWFKSSDASAKRTSIRNLLIELHQSSATDKPEELHQGSHSSATDGKSEELLVIDEDDILSDMHSNLVATLQKQINEEVEFSGRQAESADVDPVNPTPLIVDLHSDDEATAGFPVEEDLQILDGIQERLELYPRLT